MSFFEFPNTRTYDKDLGWVISEVKRIQEIVDTFVYASTLKFADPIEWNITTQYEKSTIVLDPSGNAYLSKEAVPSGIQLNNTDYWLEIFNFTEYTRTANRNLTVNVETNTTRATHPYVEDDWLIWEDVLYRVTSDIAIDDAFIVAPDAGANIIHFTVEDFIKAWITYATNLINQYKDDIDASELAYRLELAQDIANTTASLQAQLNAAIAGVTVDSEVINARVGYDGVTYATLGTAIRSQLEHLDHSTNNLIWNAMYGDLTKNGYKNIPYLRGRAKNDKTWVDVFAGNAYHNIIPVSAGDVITLHANGSNSTIYGILTDYPIVIQEGETVQYSTASGFDNALAISVNQETTFTVPSDGKFLYFLSEYASAIYKPDNVIINGLSIYNGTRELMNEIKNELSIFIEKINLHTTLSSYNYALNNSSVFVYDDVIPSNSDAVLNIKGVSGAIGETTVYFLEKNTDATYTVIDSVTLSSLNIGDNIVSIPDAVKAKNFYFGFYSESSGIGYTSVTEERLPFRTFSHDDISDPSITLSTQISMLNFAFELSYLKRKNVKGYVVVDISGGGDYTSLQEAMINEPENTTIIVRAGIYNQDMTECLKKRVVVIGTDRNQCIIRCTDGRYMHHPLYVCCGYFSNLTIISEYVNGVSQEIGLNDMGSYAIHIDTDGDYSVGKQLEFHHCDIISDFYPAVGAGLRKDFTLLFDDCFLANRQTATRGMYADSGTYGALFVHDSNGVQGKQYLKVKNCVLTSALQYCMCLEKVNRTPQNNEVYCEFVFNVLHSESSGYNNTCRLIHNPFTTIYNIDIGYGNSLPLLNT